MIITLCGSARFEPWYHAWNEVLSCAGHCVFGLGSYPSQHEEGKDWYSPEEKLVLDQVHLAKILCSDAVLILNVWAYIGESTLREFEHAKRHGKKIYFLESWGEGCGICHDHDEPSRGVAAKYNITAASPIDTFGYHCFPFDLLGEGGPFRTRLVARYRARVEHAEKT